MTTLAQIEAAADTLPPDQQEELLLFLATRLREKRISEPATRKFTKEQIASWIAEDETDARRLNIQP